MKRTIALVLLALCAITLVSARENNRRGHGFSGGRHHSWGRMGRNNYRNPQPLPEEMSISGNFTIARGMIAVVDKGTTYLVMGLNRYVGFIDGLKEGAGVTLEGYARPDPRDKSVKFMRIQKMSLNGKEYDFAQPRRERVRNGRK
ncbi:MAG: hypothetical protein LBG95_09595 [Treponema sp.]|jgi:hypothetical protein|nr:hypothetical protein [Treponema sp.]